MKFYCGTCRAKYSIPESLVAGRSVKLRCKVCAEPITVDGGIMTGQISAEHPPAAEGGEVAPAQPRLKGERNESSLLFQPAHLSAPTPGAPAPATSAEGSGLLDLQTMARTYHSPPDARADSEPGLDVPAAATAMLVLPRPEPQRPNRLLVALVGAAGMVALAAVVLAIVVVKRAGDDKSYAAARHPAALTAAAPEPASAAVPAQPAPSSAATRQASQSQPASAAVPAQPASAAVPAQPASAAVPAQPAPERPAAEPARRARPREPARARRTPRRPTAESAETPDMRETPGRGTPTANECMEELACQLAASPPACCARYARSDRDAGSSGARRTTGPDTRLPEALARPQITAAMGSVRGRVTACGSAHPGSGRVDVRIVVGGDGEVRSATVAQAPNARLGACVAAQVERARFPATRTGATFTYPFLFR